MAIISFLIQLRRALLLMKLAILKSDIEMLLESIITNLSVLNKKIRSVALSQEFSLPSWFSIYRMKEDSRPYEWYISVSILLMFLPLEMSIFFISVALLQVVLFPISGLV